MSADALARVEAVARSWEAACRSLDSDRILSNLADDAVVWYNFQPQNEVSKTDYRAYLEGSKQTFYNQRYEDFRVHYHPGGFVEQATLVGDTANGVVRTPFLLIATVKGDKITRVEEYFDSTIAHDAGLLGG